jgi:hypothetical protein
MSDEPREPAWHGFWNFNIGHVLIIGGMIGSAWVVVNNVEITLADHGTRISNLEKEMTESRRETQQWQQGISDQLNGIAREVSRLQGQVNMMIPPGRRGDIGTDDLTGGG